MVSIARRGEPVNHIFGTTFDVGRVRAGFCAECDAPRVTSSALCADHLEAMRALVEPYMQLQEVRS